MTVAEFEAFVKPHPAAKRVELPPEDYVGLVRDLFPGLTPLEFIYNGVTVAPGSPGIVAVTSPGFYWSWTVEKKKLADLCDCGAAKTNQPRHSHWCSTQVSA